MSKTLTDQYISDTYTGVLHSDLALPETGQTPIYDGDGNESSLTLGRACNGATICGKLTTEDLDVNNTLQVNSLIVNQIAFTTTALIDKIYPIGSVYFSIAEINPSTTIGGGWNQIAMGKFIVAAGYGMDRNGIGAVFYGGVSDPNGEYTHILNTNEMPYHTHTGYSVSVGDSGTPITMTNPYVIGNSKMDHQGSGHTNADPPRSDGKLDGEVRLDGVGAGYAHNNMPPSFGLCVWQRVS